MIDVKQLKYFVTIAEEGQVTKAAQKLHIAQPPLSQQLKQLEEELGVSLFDRKAKKMELTAPGKAFYEKAKQLLRQLDDAISEVKEIEMGTAGTLAVGCVKSCFYYLAQAIHQFHEQFPNVTFHLREGDTFSICQLLQERHIDIGIVRLPIDSSHYDIIPLPSDRYVAVLPKHWALSRSALSMRDFAEWPLLLLHRVHGAGQYERVVAECRRHGFEPNILCECPDATILLSLVAEGIGATIVPQSTVALFRLPGIKELEIIDSSMTAEAAVILDRQRYLPKSAHHFLDLLQQTAAMDQQ
ncbi:LysR family transcriptional regulator [Geobacillus sp. 46C-IIa]|uniref:LysR family transcriptional regulator n=1 Tax=Geobacillus sp. 46C-IIa TaxID=1963025 RepID=UPI0009BF257D|nr:LysR family transcriptional regulator [Geobacillus sp. 46C-IIa]OQP07511.1 LysR family transcriptional regulator [Geobacillus sp. 46C-IIa]QNU28323.1 LysR family transcriptional regulator [Geobacillus sp. 46C-IIa]